MAGRRVFRHRDLGTDAERATFATLHTASLAAPALRDGLTRVGAQRAVPDPDFRPRKLRGR